jgi:hypothetical protein
MRLLKINDDYRPVAKFHGFIFLSLDRIEVLFLNTSYTISFEEKEDYELFVENFAREVYESEDTYPRIIDFNHMVEDGGGKVL